VEIALIIGLVVAAAGGVFSGIVASAKKRDPLIWGIAGAAFPILGLIAIAAMPVKPQTSLSQEEVDKKNKRDEKIGLLIVIASVGGPIIYFGALIMAALTQ
jgi:hypothetical protein